MFGLGLVDGAWDLEPRAWGLESGLKLGDLALRNLKFGVWDFGPGAWELLLCAKMCTLNIVSTGNTGCTPTT